MMLARMFKLKSAVRMYLADHEKVNVLISSLEWELMEKVITLLKPFFDLTIELSSDLISIAAVIPNLRNLKYYLGKVNTSLVGSMLNDILTAIENRFFDESNQSILSNPNYFIPTILDPRFKYSLPNYDNAKAWLINMVLHTEVEESESASPSMCQPSDVPSSSTSDQPDWSACFKDILSQSKPASSSNSESASATKVEEVEKYLYDAPEPIWEDPLRYWRRNQRVYPTLAFLARKYLAIPATSVYSERLFSEFGQIYQKNRFRLRPETSEKILFLHQNLPRSNNNGRKPNPE